MFDYDRNFLYFQNYTFYFFFFNLFLGACKEWTWQLELKI